MFTRPVTAIFVHPKDRYYVVYDNGERHKLSRMKLDKISWQRKQPYNGSDDDIFLLKSQYIADTELAQHMTTYDWPDSLKGRSLRFFLSWWEKQAYQWLLEHQTNKKIDNAVSQPIEQPLANKTLANITIINNHSKTATQENTANHVNSKNRIAAAQAPKQSIAKTVKQAPENKAQAIDSPKNDVDAIDNLFDNMLSELSEEISKKL